MTTSAAPEPGGDGLLAQVPPEVGVDRIGSAVTPNNNGESSAVSRPSSRLKKALKAARAALKPILLPPWEFITETPDPQVGWAKLAAREAESKYRGKGFDAVYTTGPPHSTHLSGLKISKALDLPWIADFRDPWSRFNWEKKRNPWGRRLKPYFERKVIRAATRVILNNETSAENFRNYYRQLPAAKFTAIPNGYDPELVDEVAKLKLSVQDGSCQDGSTMGHPVICHPGTLYRQRSPLPILRALRLLRDEGMDVKFQQMGLASEDCNPLKIGQELGVGDLVEVVPRSSHQEALGKMAQADILLVIQPNAPLQVPGKLYEMLLFDSPIIGICDSPATSHVLQRAGNAWSVPTEDVAGIASAVRQAIATNRNGACQKDRQVARSMFDGRQLTYQLRDVVASAVAEHRSR